MLRPNTVVIAKNPDDNDKLLWHGSEFLFLGYIGNSLDEGIFVDTKGVVHWGHKTDGFIEK